MSLDHQLSSLPELFAADAGLVRRAARANVRVLLTAGPARWILQLSDGMLGVGPAAGPMPDWDVVLRGEAQVWLDHWAAVPPPDAADIFGMRRHGRLAIEGNFEPLMRHLQVVKDVLALPRGTA